MSGALDHVALPVPSRIGQGTAVEQSRAIAEVQAAIIVARQFPRDVQAAIREMQQSCRQMSLAERAFYRFPRGKETVTGPSVHLARELARCYGNLTYGLTELRRDDAAQQSEMLVFAWDVEQNTRTSHTFIVPHKRDRAGGPVALTDLRDIYEANTNAASRRVREAIYAILPQWFVEDAKAVCNQTLVDGGGKPLPQRIAEAIHRFGELGVTESQLAGKIGRESGHWIAQDVAQLGVIYTSLRNGEIRKEDEFESDRVTAAEVTRQPQASPPPIAATTARGPSAAGTQLPPDAGDTDSSDGYDPGEHDTREEVMARAPEFVTGEEADPPASGAAGAANATSGPSSSEPPQAPPSIAETAANHPTAVGPAGRAGQRTITEALAPMGVSDRAEKLHTCSVIVRRWLAAPSQILSTDVEPIVAVLNAMREWAETHELDPHQHLLEEVERLRGLWEADEPGEFTEGAAAP